MLTTAQLQALKAAIDADPVLSAQPLNSDGAFFIAAELNKEAAPAFIVWRKSVDTAEVGNTVNYIAVEAMTDANRNRINTFYSMNPESFSPSRPDIRTYWANTFSGALGGQGATTRDALETLWRRNATRAEQILATGTGTYQSPALMGFEGFLSYQEVEKARNS